MRQANVYDTFVDGASIHDARGNVLGMRCRGGATDGGGTGAHIAAHRSQGRVQKHPYEDAVKHIPARERRSFVLRKKVIDHLRPGTNLRAALQAYDCPSNVRRTLQNIACAAACHTAIWPWGSLTVAQCVLRPDR